jgi:hypothetical protein
MGWHWGTSSREGHNLRHHDGGSISCNRSGSMRLEGIDGEDSEEAEGEKCREGAKDVEDLVVLGW